MRWLKFTAAGNTSWGLVEGDQVVPVDGDPFREWQRGAHASSERREDRTAADPAHVLLRRPELSKAPEGSRRQARRGAGRA